MPGRIEVLSYLQECALKLRHLARERPSSISAEMVRIADEIAQQAGRLEAELIDAELISTPPANQN